jgi:hypothetical protein
LVFTRNFAQGVEAEGERVSVRNVDSPILSVVVEDHARRVQAMDQRGLVPIVDTTQQARLEATRAFYASEYAQSLRPSLRTPAVRRFALRVAIFLLLAVLAGLIR